MTDMKLMNEEVMHERKVILNFLVMLCKSSFRGILGRCFLDKLYAIASPVHLEVTKHDKVGRLTNINVNLMEA